MHLTFILASLLILQDPGNSTVPDAPVPPEAAESDASGEGDAVAAEESAPVDNVDAADVTDPDQTAAEGTEKTGSESEGVLSEVLNSGALGLLIEGGIFMWPILILGVIGAGVIIERYRSLKMLATDGGDIRQEVHELLVADRVEEALSRCDREEGPVPAVLSAGLRKFYVLRRLNYDVDRIREQVVKAMDDYNIHIVAALERHLPILATIASVAPMLGFLGTVAGMIVSFDNIDTNFGNENIVKLAAGGIKVSLLTTAFGLIIGIPAFMAFNYFTSVIDRFVLDVEESATDLIEAVTLQTALEKADAQSVGAGD